jgi:hypothetical protein
VALTLFLDRTALELVPQETLVATPRPPSTPAAAAATR